MTNNTGIYIINLQPKSTMKTFEAVAVAAIFPAAAAAANELVAVERERELGVAEYGKHRNSNIDWPTGVSSLLL